VVRPNSSVAVPRLVIPRHLPGSLDDLKRRCFACGNVCVPLFKPGQKGTTVKIPLRARP